MNGISSDRGLTLIELIVAVTIMVMVIGAATIAFTGALYGSTKVQTLLAESHDTQLVETYLPADLQSAQYSTADTAKVPTQAFPCTGVPTPTNALPSIVQLSWTETITTTTTYYVRYQIQKPTTEWVLTRFSCSSTSTAEKDIVVAHSIMDPSNSAWTSTGGANMLACGRLTVTLIESSGYAYQMSGNSRPTGTTTSTLCPGITTTTTSSTTTSTTINSSPQLLEVDMKDGNGNGKIDELDAIFSKALNASCMATSQWSLSNAPAGVLTSSPISSVSSLSTTKLKIVVAEDPSVTTPSTSAGSGATAFTASFSSTGGCNASSVSNVLVTDMAGPVALSIAVTNGNGNAAENGDTLAITFSEPILASTLPSLTPTITDSNDTETISIGGLGTLTQPGADYVNKNKVFTYSSSTVTQSGSVVTLTLGGCSSSPDCNSKKNISPAGTMTYTPASTLTDSSGNAAATTAVSKTAARF